MSHIGVLFSVRSMQPEKHSTRAGIDRRIGPKDMFIVLLYVVFIVNVLFKSIQSLLLLISIYVVYHKITEHTRTSDTRVNTQ